MKISIALPQTGSLATLDAVETIAEFGERRGVHGLWVLDRLLAPLQPRDPYPATADGTLSAQFERSLDPLQVLAFAAARTQRIRLGTAVLVMPWYSPMMLARTLATLDELSAGRLDVGFGLGWSSDELEAAGSSHGTLAARTDEFLDVLFSAWTNDVVSHSGAHFSVPPSHVQLAPRQSPRPPVYFAAYTPGALRRIARVGDGWIPAGLPADAMSAMWDGIRHMAEGFGRDPDDLKLVVRGNIWSTQHVADTDRPMFVGDARQIADDVERCEALGAHEVILDAQFSESSRNLTTFTEALDDIVTTIESAMGAGTFGGQRSVGQ